MTEERTSERRRNSPRGSRLYATVRAVERRRAVRRRSLAGLGVLLGLAALAAGGYWGGLEAWHALFTQNDFFRIRHVEVTTDGALGAAQVQEYAKVREGLNLFAVRPQDVRAALLSVPLIANAQVGRRLPDTLIIEVAERVAVARLGRPGAGCPLAVDVTGHVLGPSSVRASLPVILGVRDVGLRPGDVVQDPMLEDALTVLEICNEAKMREALVVASIGLDNEEWLDVGLETGEQVLLSRDGLADKLRQLPILRKVASDRGLDLAVYDMTVDRNFVGRPQGLAEAEAGAPE